MEPLKTATRPNPQIAEPFDQLSIALDKLHDTDGAITAAIDAARLNQGNEHYFFHLADLYFASKKFDQANLLFEQLASSNAPSISSLAAQRLQSLKAAASPPYQ